MGYKSCEHVMAASYVLWCAHVRHTMTDDLEEKTKVADGSLLCLAIAE